VLFFDYPKAAETFDKISANEHFGVEERREAARQALGLYASLDDRAGMNRSRQRYHQLGASAEDLAEADFTIASVALAKWDERGPQEGSNRRARDEAERAMESFYTNHLRQASSARFVVRAAYHMARIKRAARSKLTELWWTRTIQSFERYRAAAPQKDGRSV